ncbi:MAG: MBL fold metallo-hydrolase [Gammaproteobacteria bacterium]|nr:MAG: MBL fold metallo-hydrolase [Gammaproteobacteria bacterium]
MRFASLGSGSKGNALIVEAGGVRVLVDCGFTAREAERRMQRLGIDPQTLDAILVTHEHGDHVRGVPVLSRRFRLPVWMTAGTRRNCRDNDLHDVQIIHGHAEWRLGDLRIRPFTVPHDAAEPVQFVFDDGRHRLGLLTDLGSITGHVLEMLDGVDGLLLECNHDPEMLASGPYPPALQARVGGNWGHLANAQARELLQRLDLARLQRLVGMHLSEQNNRPELAEEALQTGAQGSEAEIMLACQEGGFGWQVLA